MTFNLCVTPSYCLISFKHSKPFLPSILMSGENNLGQCLHALNHPLVGIAADKHGIAVF